jgi:predicted lipoprotein
MTIYDMFTKYLSLFALPLLGLSLFGVLPDARAATLAESNQAMVEQGIIPGYRKLADATEALDAAAKGFCDKPDQAGLDTFSAGYQETMDAWQAIRYVRFGPVELFLRHHRFQTWPDRRNSVGKQIGVLIEKADPKVDDPERFARASVAVQGLSALERLLFSPDVSPETFRNAYRCRLLQAISGNLRQMSADVLAAWSGGDASYRDILIHPGPDNPVFESDQEVAGELLNGLYTALTEMEELKLGRPMGEGARKTRPRRAESWRSGRSLRNLRINLAAVRALYREGFSNPVHDAALGRRVDNAFESAAKALADLPGDGLAPLLESDEGWQRLQQARAALTELRRLIATELAPALDLALGFNSLDGD